MRLGMYLFMYLMAAADQFRIQHQNGGNVPFHAAGKKFPNSKQNVYENHKYKPFYSLSLW